MTPTRLAAASALIALLPLAAAAQEAADDTPDDAGSIQAQESAPTAEDAAPEAEDVTPEDAAPDAAQGAGDAGNAATGGEAAAPAQPGAAEGEVAAGALYKREEHGAWEVRCLRTPEGQPDPCQIFQLLSDGSGNPTAEVTFADLPDGNDIAGAASITVPLETLLTEQLSLAIDGDRARKYPFQYCTNEGCVVQIGFTAEDMARFRRGSAATVTVVPARAPDRTAELSMSLIGFTAGMAAIEIDG